MNSKQTTAGNGSDVFATLGSGLLGTKAAKELLDSLDFGKEVLVISGQVKVWRMIVMTRITKKVLTVQVKYMANKDLSDPAIQAEIMADAQDKVLSVLEMVLDENNVLNNGSASDSAQPPSPPANPPAPQPPSPPANTGNQGGNRPTRGNNP